MRGDVVRVATATADRVDVDVDGVECMMITVMPMWVVQVGPTSLESRVARCSRVKCR